MTSGYSNSNRIALPIKFVVVSFPANIRVLTIGKTSEVSKDLPSTSATASEVIKSSFGHFLLSSIVASK